MIPPPISPRLPAGLSHDQVSELILARDRSIKLRRAVSVATFDAWMIAIFAGFTLISGLFSFPTFLLALAMGYCAWGEFRGIKELRILAPHAAKNLATNQLILGGALIAYSVMQIVTSLTAPEGAATAMANGDPQLVQMLAPMDKLEQMLTLTVYGVMILIAIFAQGGTALYYASRQKHLNLYLHHTPPWIIDLQRRGVAL